MSTTFTKTAKIMDYAINADGPGCSYMSVSRATGLSDCPTGINLVIGARFEDRAACGFSKADIAELIATLQDIHAAMVG